MMWRRLLGALVIFVTGIGVGGTLLHLYASRSENPTAAQRSALRVLDQPPLATSIGDNRIVDAVKADRALRRQHRHRRQGASGRIRSGSAHPRAWRCAAKAPESS